MTRSERAAQKRWVREANRAERREAREKRWRQRFRWWKCFWTFPVGHAWIEVPDGDYMDGTLDRECSACGKLNEYQYGY